MKTEIIATDLVTDTEKEALYRLFQTHFLKTDYEVFLKDFSEKNWLIRMTEPIRGAVVGFSTQQLYQEQLETGPVRVLFSGDTIVDPNYWNQSTLAGAFGQLINRIEPMDGEPLYWLLICKGFRTYRFLPVFFRQYFPSVRFNDPELQRIAEVVAERKFGGNYDAQKGILDVKGTKDCLNEKLAAIPSSKINDPHVSLFLEKNPDFASGNELVCLTRLHCLNLTSAGRRVTDRTQVQWKLNSRLKTSCS